MYPKILILVPILTAIAYPFALKSGDGFAFGFAYGALAVNLLAVLLYSVNLGVNVRKRTAKDNVISFVVFGLLAVAAFLVFFR